VPDHRKLESGELGEPVFFIVVAVSLVLLLRTWGRGEEVVEAIDDP